MAKNPSAYLQYLREVYPCGVRAQIVPLIKLSDEEIRAASLGAQGLELRRSFESLFDLREFRSRISSPERE